MRQTPSSLTRQRGAALLIIAFLVLFVLTLVVLYINRSLIYEQKASASLARSTSAFELADAGLEWGIASLNNSRLINDKCVADITYYRKEDFRGRYAAPLPETPDPATGAVVAPRFAVPANSRAACVIDGAATLPLTCSCPVPVEPAAVLSLPSPDLGRFMVEFRPFATDPLAVEVIARGCTSADPQCGDASGSADATAVSRALVKLVGLMGQAPPAAMLAGGFVSVSGSMTVVNIDHASNGITVMAGGDFSLKPGIELVSLPGTPPAASVLANDSALNQLTKRDDAGDHFFQAFFAKSMESFRQQSLTQVIKTSDCGTSNDCGKLVSSYIDQGVQQFWIYPNVTFTSSNLPKSGTLGTDDRPVYIATAGTLELKAAIKAYGIFYAATGAYDDWDYAGSGSATVFGSFISRGSFNKGSGDLRLIYNPKLTGLGGGKPVGTLVRVPGSWRDFLR